MRTIALSAGVAALAALAGCAECSRDPSQVGLGCAASNLASGVYEEDDARIQAEIDALAQRRAELRAEASRLRAQAAQLRGQRRASASRLSRLNRDAATLNARIDSLSRRRDADQARLAQLRAEESALSRAVLNADAQGVSQADIDKLEARRKALVASIERLIAAS